MSDEITKKATMVFFNAMQDLKSDDDICYLAQQLCILCSQTINGIKGKQFQTEFLTGAILDKTRITAHKLTKH